MSGSLQQSLSEWIRVLAGSRGKILVVVWCRTLFNSWSKSLNGKSSTSWVMILKLNLGDL